MPDVKHFEPEGVLGVAELLFWRQGVAATGIQDVVAATGLSRSSLYNAFGGKDALYVGALRRYVEHRSTPMFSRLAEDRRGLPAIEDFFSRLVSVRCRGEFAGWGCLVSNAHLENPSGEAKTVLDNHQAGLKAALQSALETAAELKQLRPGLDLSATAEHLTLLAYAINLRSRAGASPDQLKTAVAAALSPLARDPRRQGR
ncbi:TetR family transcriptional regulator [Kribbella voronezhensis]|uniref:TetR family transcriptional regulator n=1 Tax=Kribbella voronezhensis TaxID=2512212 RepID=A0A4R7TF72_9ACTN|nr:TetR/AcrR family transcriptional regulator [Kribbella voronezhensis]TDU90186.1 TetR family transcriptional regulator [Kribbella voronezhensis]